MTDFNSETAITAGGWDPRYARVITVQEDGDAAAAVVDANGDGADMNVELYVRRSDGQWGAIASGNGDEIGLGGLLATWTGGDRLTLTRTGDDFE